ncbi:unnamed protein product [Linum tenue]|uniref:glucan endo-1,3-beta-D-glucosidase n=1 Tax=Linum tenue TaxID=586396 RepID=A0AAV0HXE7_9ROSI|nr:unnamed protein product [Linum tenue]
MTALLETDIEVMLAIPNYMLRTMAEDRHAAKAWVEANVTDWCFHGGVNVKYVAVGNEPFLQNVQRNLRQVHLTSSTKTSRTHSTKQGWGHKVKATVPFNADVYNSPESDQVPSAGDFRPEVKDLTLEIIQFLHSNDAPFTVNIYPFLSLYGNPYFPVDFAFFDDATNTNKPIKDGRLALHQCLRRKLRHFGLVSYQVRVPGHGHHRRRSRLAHRCDLHATVENAKRFNQGLLKHIVDGNGTPARPVNKIEVFLFSLIDENGKSVAPGNFERALGDIRMNGQKDWGCDFSGLGLITVEDPSDGDCLFPVMIADVGSGATAVVFRVWWRVLVLVLIVMMML